MLLMVTVIGFAQTEELGEVNWLRDYESALAQSKAEGKPVLILFQEVPGCATCRNYGNNVLSHPLIVDAIENEFVPLAIFNNKGGKDRQVLEHYGEPTWNNPVVRIVDAKGADVISRLSGRYSAVSLVSHMSLALKGQGIGVPAYLSLLQQELEGSQGDTAYYQMYCFWSGESALGAAEGVVETEPGFMNGAEVVKVKFDPEVISKRDLDKVADKASAKYVTNVSKFREDRDPQYYLKHSPYKYLPLAEIQKTKINAALVAKQDPSVYLSPSQLSWLSTKDLNKSLYDQPLEKAWKLLDKEYGRS